MDRFRRLLRFGARAERGREAHELRPSRDVLTGERDGLAVLLDLRREVYLGLDEVGTIIWQELVRGSEPPAIAARICEEYEAPYDVAERDTRAFLDELMRHGLAVRA